MALHYDTYWHTYTCDECGHLYETTNHSPLGDLIWKKSSGHEVCSVKDGCPRCQALERNLEAHKTMKTFETMSGETRRISTANAAKAEYEQPGTIGRMVLTQAPIDTTRDRLYFECPECRATVEADDNTTDGVILVGGNSYRDCPYCVTQERREADMTDLPDFGAF